MDEYTITPEELQEFLMNIVEESKNIIDYLDKTEEFLPGINNNEITYRLDIVKNISNDILILFNTEE